MAFDDRAKALAARMLAPKPGGKGQAVNIIVPGAGGTFDPKTDRTTGATPPTTLKGSGVETAYDARSIDGTVIKRGDVKFLLSPVQFSGADMPEPKPDHARLKKVDGEWAIKNVSVVRPAGLGVLYELQLRRGA